MELGIARPWTLTPAGRATLRRIARLRLQDPGDRALADALGISVRAVQYHLLNLRNSVKFYHSDTVLPLAWVVESKHGSAADLEPDASPVHGAEAGEGCIDGDQEGDRAS